MHQEKPLSGILWVKTGVLLAIALLISLFSWFPLQVETVYATGFYPKLADFFRNLTGWAPFSIGDIVYAFVFIVLIIKLIKGVLYVYRREYTRRKWVLLGFGLLRAVLWVYIVFKLVWGLNYDRLGIAYQLKINKKEYTREEVAGLTHQLIDKLNECRRQMPDTVLAKPGLDSIFRESFRSYQTLSADFGFLNYRNRSVKASLYSGIADYLGFTGYYNPFTGEAQVRSDVPRILVPYIACHEMAHQLGYASESEANFVGYLAAAASKDVYFRYSVYNDLFSYAQGEELVMYGKEKNFKAFAAVVQYNRTHLDSLVKKDRREIREFFHIRRNRISPAVSGLYDQYLKMNKQLQGVNSYNEVVGWLIAYQQKYGKL